MASGLCAVVQLEENVVLIRSMTALAGAGAVAAGAYLDAKYHFSKDLSWLWSIKNARRGIERASTWQPSNYRAVWSIERSIETLTRLWKLLPSACPYGIASRRQSTRCRSRHRACGSRESTYTWREAYDTACRFGQYFLSLGIRRGQPVALNVSNSPEYMLMIFAAWAVGSAAVLINHNLSGDALLHCMKLSKTKVLIVDEDSQIRQRVEEIRGRLEGELGMRIIVLDSSTKSQVMAMDAKRPEDHYRDSNEGQDSALVMFTRSVPSISL